MASVRQVRNVRIRSVMLGVEDHGLLTAVVFFEGESWGQGFGTFNFGSADEGSTPAQAQNLSRFVLNVLRVVGVSSWEELPGKYARVDADCGKVCRVGNLLRDEWFDPEDHFLKQ